MNCFYAYLKSRKKPPLSQFLCETLSVVLYTILDETYVDNNDIAASI